MPSLWIGDTGHMGRYGSYLSYALLAKFSMSLLTRIAGNLGSKDLTSKLRGQPQRTT